MHKAGGNAVKDAALAYVLIKTSEDELQELNKVTNFIHNTDHKIVNDFHKATPELKKLGVDAWHGIEWCYTNDLCKAAVKKYGVKAVEDAAEGVVIIAIEAPSYIGLMELNELQELNKFTNFIHNTDHKIVNDFHKAEPELKKLGVDAWHGIEWCYTNDPCKAAVKKYGAKAVEDAAKAFGLMELNELQELNGFSTWRHNFDNRVHNFDNKVKAEWKNKIGPDLKRLGLDAWHGIEWCYKTAPCKDAVEKYGEIAVEAALTAAALQNLSFFSKAEHWTKGAFKTVEHDTVKAADAAAPILKMVGGEAWKGATACYANAECKAAVEKYGEKAVEAAMTKKVLILLI